MAESRREAVSLNPGLAIRRLENSVNPTTDGNLFQSDVAYMVLLYFQWNKSMSR